MCFLFLNTVQIYIYNSKNQHKFNQINVFNYYLIFNPMYT